MIRYDTIRKSERYERRSFEWRVGGMYDTGIVHSTLTVGYRPLPYRYFTLLYARIDPLERHNSDYEMKCNAMRGFSRAIAIGNPSCYD